VQAYLTKHPGHKVNAGVATIGPNDLSALKEADAG
jgi:hypothetical protein